MYINIGTILVKRGVPGGWGDRFAGSHRCKGQGET